MVKPAMVKSEVNSEAVAETVNPQVIPRTRDRSDKVHNILGIRYKLQRAADRFLTNEWLQVSLAVLMTQQAISERAFWSKLKDLNLPLAGNGITDEKCSHQSTRTRDCLYTAATLVMDGYSRDNTETVETKAQRLKKGTIEHLERIVQHLQGSGFPTEQSDTDRYSVSGATLLGQLLRVLSPAELQEYTWSMKLGAPHPAGPLDICALSHFLGKDFKVYRQVDDLQ